MRLSEYSDDEIIGELKHRGIKIEVPEIDMNILKTSCGNMWHLEAKKVIIGGVVFDLK